MGQYYRPVIETDNGNIVAIDTYLDGEYECAKLMEQSWFPNTYVNAVVSAIYNKKKRIAWVGDYADNVVDEFPNIPVTTLYNTAYGENAMPMQHLKSSDFTLDDKFFVNHDTKEYLDLNKYKAENTVDGWCTHPVSLLVAIGNGQGGGDFYTHAREQDIANVGKWAWNTVEITDKAPTSYKEVMYHFIEE